MMMTSPTPAPLSEKASVLALVAATLGPWHATASLIEAAGSATRLLRRDWSGFDLFDREHAQGLIDRVSLAHLEHAERTIEGAHELGAELITILDDAYPVNLRQVFNRPPFLFIKGSLRRSDDRAVAVVGTREATDAGRSKAVRLARALTEAGVTVLSGLARGIDTAAHSAALAAGGRTIAVIGTGIATVYPAENTELAAQIVGSGALVSQFWPTAPPTRASFPQRNAVMSGMAIGTVVVEAASTSGARMQARLALQHGKRLFLMDSLVASQPWARKYADHPAATVISSADDVLAVVLETTAPVQQLSFG